MIDSKGTNKAKTVRRRVMKGMKNMELIAEQADSNSYLASTEIVDVQDPTVQAIITDIRTRADSDVARFVR